LKPFSIKIKRKSYVPELPSKNTLMDDAKNQRKLFTRQKEKPQTVFIQARLMTEGGSNRFTEPVGNAPMSMETSAGIGMSTKRNSTQATQRKKIGNQLDNYLAKNNLVNYK
jgi:hypothetical protein